MPPGATSRSIEMIITARNDARAGFQAAEAEAKKFAGNAKEIGRAAAAAAGAGNAEHAANLTAAAAKQAAEAKKYADWAAVQRESMLAREAAGQRLTPFKQQKDAHHAEAYEAAKAAEDARNARRHDARDQAMHAGQFERAATAAAFARNKIDLDARLAARKAAKADEVQHLQNLEAKGRADAGSMRDRTAIEQRYYLATHSYRQVELRNLQNYYAQMRAQHAGNAKMLALIDKSYQAEAANLTGGGGLLGRLGGKGLVKQELKYAAGSMAGIHGGEVGMAASAALSMTPIAGAVVAGLITAGGLYQAATSHAAKLVEAQAAHVAAVKDGVDWLRRLAAEQSTASGEQFKSRADEMAKGYADANKEIEKSIKDMGILEANWAALQALGRSELENSDFGKATQEAQAAANVKMKEEMKLRAWAKEEDAIRAEQRQAGREAATESARLAAMAEGPEKRRLELLQQQAEATRKLAEAQRERMSLAVKNGDPAAIAALAAEQEKDRQAQGQQHKYASDSLAGREKATAAEQYHRDQVSAQEASINASKTGYDRELALLVLKQKEEVAEYDKAGRDKFYLLQKQADDRVAMRQREGERLKAIEKAKADANENLQYETEELRIRAIADAADREKKLLELRQSKEREAARKAGLDMNILDRKQAAERDLLDANGATRGSSGSAGIVDRGWMHHAPGQFSDDPIVKVSDGVKEANKAFTTANATLTAMLNAINQLLAAQGQPPVVVNFP